MRYAVSRDGKQVGDLYLRDARSKRAPSSLEDAITRGFPGATRVQSDAQRIVLKDTQERFPYASISLVIAANRGVYVTLFASNEDVDTFSKLDLSKILTSA